MTIVKTSRRKIAGPNSVVKQIEGKLRRAPTVPEFGLTADSRQSRRRPQHRVDFSYSYAPRNR
jgi:hypothetical protein